MDGRLSPNFLTEAKIPVTNLQTSPTHAGSDPTRAMAEQQAMAKSSKPGNHDPIAAALKEMHDAVASEALPDDFLRLLDEIDSKIAEKKETH
jgi:DNA-binding GntR family transcriptional regulator